MSKMLVAEGKNIVKAIKEKGDVVSNMPIPMPDVLNFFNKLWQEFEIIEVIE